MALAEAVGAAAAKAAEMSVDSWAKVVTKVGVPTLGFLYLLRFVVGGLSSEVKATHEMLQQHQEQMQLNNQAQSIYLYQMCVSMAVTSGRPALACPQPQPTVVK